MNNFKVLLCNGNEVNIIADHFDLTKNEVSETKTEYGRYKSYIWMLDFCMRSADSFDIPIASFNYHNIIGFYDATLQKELKEREKE